MGFKILPAREALVYKAAELKANYRISYADCFASACVLEQSAILGTADSEFKNVAHLINIQWIR